MCCTCTMYLLRARSSLRRGGGGPAETPSKTMQCLSPAGCQFHKCAPFVQIPQPTGCPWCALCPIQNCRLHRPRFRRCSRPPAPQGAGPHHLAAIVLACHETCHTSTAHTLGAVVESIRHITGRGWTQRVAHGPGGCGSTNTFGAGQIGRF